MATTFQSIRTKVEDKLKAISDIQEVHRFPELQFEGYPAAVITPAEGESDYETNAEDQRVYAFDIHLFYEYKDLGKDTALDRLYDVGDSVLDSFASDKVLSGISLAAGRDIMTTDPVYAGWDDLSDNELLQLTISIKVTVSIDL